MTPIFRLPVLVALFVASTALAQDAVAPAGVFDAKSEILRVFVQYLLVPIAAGLAGLVGWVLISVRKWLEARSGSSLLAKAAMKVDDVLLAVVHDIEANEKADLVEAAKDGVITPEEFATLKAKAIGRAKAVLGDKGLEQLKSAFGFGSVQLEHYLSGKLEAAVAAVSSDAARTAALSSVATAPEQPSP